MQAETERLRLALRDKVESDTSDPPAAEGYKGSKGGQSKVKAEEEEVEVQREYLCPISQVSPIAFAI